VVADDLAKRFRGLIFKLPEHSDHPARISTDRLLKDCKITRTRRSGPGGQHRNKVESAVVIQHLPSAVVAEANERRSQKENRDEAIFRLRCNLAIAVRTAFASAECSKLWQSRVRGGKISVNQYHDDFPALLSEALDVMQKYDFDAKSAAAFLKITVSQLLKFLKVDRRAFAILNETRSQAGLKPYN
jgi:hypothetical protein